MYTVYAELSPYSTELTFSEMLESFTLKPLRNIVYYLQRNKANEGLGVSHISIFVRNPS